MAWALAAASAAARAVAAWGGGNAAAAGVLGGGFPHGCIRLCGGGQYDGLDPRFDSLLVKGNVFLVQFLSRIQFRHANILIQVSSGTLGFLFYILRYETGVGMYVEMG